MPNINPFSKIITQQFKDTYSSMINAMLEDEAMTTPCRLIYESSKTEICPNCNINPVSGKSSGVYNGSGPISFIQGKCPVCLGEGKKILRPTEDLYLLAIWDMKKFWPSNLNIQTGEVYVQTMCNISLMPKLKRAREIIVNTRIEDYVRHTFIRANEPELCGCCLNSTDAFIFTNWRRSN